MSNQEFEVTYTGKYTPLRRSELIERLRKALTSERFEHVLRVEQTAIQLAQQYGESTEKASIAGLVHDYAKQRPDADFIMAIKKYHMDSELLDYGNAIWHGVVGWHFVNTELQVNDIDILKAVEYHTVGHQYMSKLAQIVYMADYIEPGRDFSGVELARTAAAESLAFGVRVQTQQTLSYLIKNKRPVYPQTIVTYNAWVPVK